MAGHKVNLLASIAQLAGVQRAVRLPNLLRQLLQGYTVQCQAVGVGLDLDGIRAALKQEVFDSLAKMKRGFLRQMDEIGKDQQ